MCAGQAERPAGTPRPDGRPAEAAAPRADTGELALDAASLVGTTAPNSSLPSLALAKLEPACRSYTPRSNTSLPSLALTGTTTASDDESDFVETPRSEVGVPRAEWCWQPRAAPDAGAPPPAEWCWQPHDVLFQQQPTGQAGEWQHDQQQAQMAQVLFWPVQPVCMQIPQEQELSYLALNCQDQFAAQFTVVAQPEAQQFMAFDEAAEGPKGKGKGKGSSGKGKGKGGSASAQGGQHGARSGKRPSPLPASDAAWCDARLADLGAADTRGDALAAVRGQALQLSFDKAGTRLVQRALEVADREARDALLVELSGHILEMMESPHANYVAQKIFEVLPAERLGAVIKEFEGQAERVARHRFGCRILIQLFAHCLKRPECAKLVDGLLSKAHELCCHTFAHHVIEAILEHTHDDQHKHSIYRALSANLLGNAQHYHGSYVVKAALTHCSDADVRSLWESLTGSVVGVTATRIRRHLCQDLCPRPRAWQ